MGIFVVLVLFVTRHAQSTSLYNNIRKCLHKSNHEISFFDMLYQSENAGNSWMFNHSKVTDWDGSRISNEDSIRKIWDALILVNKISTPEYLDYEYDYLKINERSMINDEMNMPKASLQGKRISTRPLRASLSKDVVGGKMYW